MAEDAHEALKLALELAAGSVDDDGNESSDGEEIVAIEDDEDDGDDHYAADVTLGDTDVDLEGLDVLNDLNDMDAIEKTLMAGLDDDDELIWADLGDDTGFDADAALLEE